MNLKDPVQIQGRWYVISTVDLPGFGYPAPYETCIFPAMKKMSGEVEIISWSESFYDRTTSEHDALTLHRVLVAGFNRPEVSKLPLEQALKAIRHLPPEEL